jgi:hypothetical protein
MAQKFLYGSKVIAAFEQVGGEGMPERMIADVLDHAGLASAFP